MVPDLPSSTSSDEAQTNGQKATTGTGALLETRYELSRKGDSSIIFLPVNCAPSFGKAQTVAYSQHTFPFQVPRIHSLRWIYHAIYKFERQLTPTSWSISERA